MATKKEIIDESLKDKDPKTMSSSVSLLGGGFPFRGSSLDGSDG